MRRSLVPSGNNCYMTEGGGKILTKYIDRKKKKERDRLQCRSGILLDERILKYRRKYRNCGTFR